MPMKLVAVTRRTKRAVRVWANAPEEQAIFLDDKLSDLRPGGIGELRVRVNEEFENSAEFPISPADWEELDPSTVRDVRDEVAKRLGVKT